MSPSRRVALPGCENILGLCINSYFGSLITLTADGCISIFHRDSIRSFHSPEVALSPRVISTAPTLGMHRWQKDLSMELEILESNTEK